MGIAPLLNDACRFLQLDFDLIKQHPHQMYDFAHIWIPEKSLMRERYSAVLGHTPRVLFGLPQSWEPLLHVIRHPSEVLSVALSPDGGRLASGSEDEIVRIWNTATGELENELEGHTDWVFSVAFLHNGHFIVSGSKDMSVRIWNMATCETTYMLMGHTSPVTSVAISRNDKFVVSGSWDRTVRIWETETGEPLRELKGHVDEVESVAVSPDCQHIASGSRGEVWIWTKDGVIEHKLECPTEKYNEVYDLAFSHNGHRILCNVDRTEWTTTGHRLSTLDTDNCHDITSIAYSPNDNEIAYGTLNGRVMIWNMETNETHKLGSHSDWVYSIAFSPDGSRIASGSYDGTVRIWDPRLWGTFSEEVDLGGPSVALSHDGHWIVTVSHHHIQVWTVTETMTKMNELSIDDVLSLALSCDDSRIVIGCRDGSIQVWNHLTNTIECQMSGHSNWVWSVAFSYDGCHVVSGSDDKTVQIWDCHTGNEVALYQHSEMVTCVTFSHDGGCVAFGDNHSVWIWNLSTGQIHTNPDNKSGRQGWTDSVAFSHDSNHVISGGEGGVWIWNVMTNNSTKVLEEIQLPDGTRVHPLGKGNFHIYGPVDEETTNNISPYLLSISPDHNWITGEQGEHICWIHPQYQAFCKAHIAKSIVCLHSVSGTVVLDLKSTQHTECVMPGV